MADEIPEWARRRAYQLTEDAGDLPSDPRGWAQKVDRTRAAFARYISEHEEPPVDPLLVEAREIVGAEWPESAGADFYRNGNGDGGLFMRVASAALRRGMELAREANHG